MSTEFRPARSEAAAGGRESQRAECGSGTRSLVVRLMTGRAGSRTHASSTACSRPPMSRSCTEAIRLTRTTDAPPYSPGTLAAAAAGREGWSAGHAPAVLVERADGGRDGRVRGEGAPGRLLLVPDNVHHRVDQRQMSERLREVAQVTARPRVDLLTVEQQRTGVGEHLLAQVARLLKLTDLEQRPDHPERA